MNTRASRLRDFIEQLERFAHEAEAVHAAVPGERAEGSQDAYATVAGRLREFIDWPRKTGVRPK